MERELKVAQATRLLSTLPFLILAFGVHASLWSQESFSDADLEFFESKVRPILVEHCSQCHGQDVEEPSGGFSITSRAAIIAGGDTGSAIVVGHPAKSLLIESVSYTGDYEMPPSSKLDAKSIQLLTQWVQMGAPWPDQAHEAKISRATFDIQKRKQEHWCWQPVASPKPPPISRPDWAYDPLDNFVFEKIVAAGLQPADDATKREWIRRVYFDLIGLPPAPDQVDVFVDDDNRTAFESVVDELLASPHFGERWARHWMDLFRYADTYGHEFDFPLAHAFEYRDYLIRAFNADVPYDDFIREHLAGDLLDQPRVNPQQHYNESVLGTGFWFLGEALHGPVDVKADEAGRIDNQIDVMCKSFLGLTVACARCHDHKFDAISDEDYYAMSGFLQSSRRQKAMLDTDRKISDGWKQIQPELEQSQTTVDQFMAEIKELDFSGFDFKSAIEKIKSAKDDRHLMHALYLAFVAKVPDTFRRATFEPYLKTLDTLESQHGDFVRNSILMESFAHGVPEDWFTNGWSVETKPRDGLQFSALGSLVVGPGSISSGRYGGRFFGTMRSPTFEITHDRIHVRARGSVAAIRLIIDGYEMDVHNALLFAGCKFEMSTPNEFQWMDLAGDVKNYRGHKAWLEFIDHGDSYFEVDEIRLADSNCCGPVDRPSVLGRQIAQQVIQDEESTIEQSVEHCFRQFLSAVDEYPENEAAQWLSLLAEHCDAGKPMIETRDRVNSMANMLPEARLAIAITDGTPEDEHLFIRGNSNTLGDRVPRRFLTALTPETDGEFSSSGSGRLELANQIASAQNPLTSRVAVNRIWHHLLGRGIVSSVDNFGVLGEKPSHPQLLDYLATRFVEDDWSIKRLVKRLVLSRTYRMSSQLDPAAAEIDPENKLLHRANVRRLQAEAIRDTMLMVSGALDRKRFGKPVPIHFTDFMQGRGRPRGGGGSLDGQGRRSIYLIVRRNFLSPMMLAFDSPIPFNSIGKRHQSNVPAQALILMNDPFVLEQARKWATKLIQSAPDRDHRITLAFYESFGRVPGDQEVEQAQQFFEDHADGFDSMKGEELEQQLWQDFCHVLFNMKEFIYIR